MDFGGRIRQNMTASAADEENRKKGRAEEMAREKEGVQALRQPGRPRSRAVTSRKYTLQVFMTEEVDMNLREIKLRQKVDMKDVVYAATKKFLKAHFKDGKLDAIGLEFVRDSLSPDEE